MFSRSPEAHRFLQGALLAVVLGAVLTHRAGAAQVSVCIDSASPTAHMDERVARGSLGVQGATVRIVPFVGIGRGGDGFPLAKFARLAVSDCQLIMGFPVDATEPRLPPDVEATAPYLHTGFVLVRRTRTPALSLSELPQGSEVGIAQLDTYAGLLYGQHPNIVMHVYRDDAEMLADLKRREIVAGLAWEPAIAGLTDAGAIRVEPLAGRHMRWNLVALYAVASQSTAVQFEQGLQRLRADGVLKTLLGPYEGGAPATTVSKKLRGERCGQSTSSACGAEATARRVRTTEVGTSPRGSRTACTGHRPPALYTQEQAEQGARVYTQNCAMCHGPELQGQPGGFSGPALKGAAFADPSYGFRVRDIFNFVAKLMPAPSPGSLSKSQDVQVMSFLLQQNGFPAGARELTYEQAKMSNIPLRYYGK